MQARIEMAPLPNAASVTADDNKAIRLQPGAKDIHVILKLTNNSGVPQRVLLSGLRLMDGQTDSTARFWSLPPHQRIPSKERHKSKVGARRSGLF